MNGRLADLHLHMYGSIHYMDYLDFLVCRDVDWQEYESGYLEAFGERPPIRDLLARHKSGDHSAVEYFRRLFVFGDDDGGDFARFQAKYDLLISGSDFPKHRRGEASFSAVVDELCGFIHKVIARQRMQGVGYAEQRMLLSPSFSREQARDFMIAILESYASYEGTNVVPRFALSLPREDPWPDWEVVREVALGPFGNQLTGIDFCNVEEGHPPREKQELFDEVKSFNSRHPNRALAILYHVGESFKDKSLESAVRWVHEAAGMGANRLGHAIALGIDPQLYGRHVRDESVGERIDQLRYDIRHREGLQRHGVQIDASAADQELRRLQAQDPGRIIQIDYDDHRLEEVKSRQKYAIECIKSLGSIVEVCPTSNRRIAGVSDPKHHPLVQFAANDVPFVVGTDDPGIFDTTLADEIRSAIEIAGLPEDAFEEIAKRAWASRSEVLVGREAP